VARQRGVAAGADRLVPLIGKTSTWHAAEQAGAGEVERRRVAGCTRRDLGSAVEVSITARRDDRTVGGRGDQYTVPVKEEATGVVDMDCSVRRSRVGGYCEWDRHDGKDHRGTAQPDHLLHVLTSFHEVCQ